MKNPKTIPKPLLEQMEQAKKQALFMQLRRLQREEVMLALLIDLSVRLPEHGELMKTENDHSIYYALAEVALGCVCEEIDDLERSVEGDQSEDQYDV